MCLITQKSMHRIMKILKYVTCVMELAVNIKTVLSQRSDIKSSLVYFHTGQRSNHVVAKKGEMHKASVLTQHYFRNVCHTIHQQTNKKCR